MREIARCGLACFLCNSADNCPGCRADGCPGAQWCETRRCAIEKGLDSCGQCGESDCRKGLLQKLKPRAFLEFIRHYGENELCDCLERNAKNGVRYHYDGVHGDYDDFEDMEALIEYIRTGHAAPGAKKPRPVEAK